MAKPGRKSGIEELQIVRRYQELTEPFFKVLKRYLTSKKPEDQKWAVEQLNKAYTKMIPQDLTSGGEKLPPTTVILQEAKKALDDIAI